MKNKQMLATVGILAAGAMVLSACGSQVSTPLPEVIKVENVGESSDGKVTITSRETVKVTPDMAKIVYGITTENEDSQVCQQENTDKLNAVLEYLKGQGFEEKSIQTSGYSMDPRYDWSGNKQTLIGYEMRTQVTLSDVPMDRVGSLLSETVASGANEIQSVSYYSSGYDEAYQQALTKAVESARAKAETLAIAGGKKIGGVLGIQEYRDYQDGRYVSAVANLFSKAGATETAAARDMGVMPGEMEVTAQINVDFSLVP